MRVILVDHGTRTDQVVDDIVVVVPVPARMKRVGKQNM